MQTPYDIGHEIAYAQWSPEQDAFFREYLECTTPVPDHATKRYYGEGDARVILDLAVLPSFPTEPNRVDRAYVEALNKGQGHARNALTFLEKLANKHGVTMSCDIIPMDDSPISSSDYKAMLRNRGYEAQGGGRFIWRPRGAGGS